MKTKAILTGILVVVILAAALLVLPGCNKAAEEQKAQAARLQAEAELARAEASRESAKAEAEADRVRAVADAEAQRQRAIAEKAQAQAEAERTSAAAYEQRLRAETSAAAEAAAVRQAERDASYERTLGLLPFVLLIVGVISVGALAVVALAGGLRRPVAIDPGVVFLLRRQQDQLDALERAAYHQIALEQRRQLAAGVGHQVIVYDGEGRVIGDER